MKTGFKAGFPLQPYRNVTYRSFFFCVEVISFTLVLRKQRNTLRLRYDTVEVENRLKSGTRNTVCIKKSIGFQI